MPLDKLKYIKSNRTLKSYHNDLFFGRYHNDLNLNMNAIFTQYINSAHNFKMGQKFVTLS